MSSQMLKCMIVCLKDKPEFFYQCVCVFLALERVENPHSRGYEVDNCNEIGNVFQKLKRIPLLQ